MPILDAILTGSLVLAGAFGTFVIFLFLGLIALPVTAALDKSLGKEKALLLYAVALLAFTLFVLAPEGPTGKPGRAGRENDVRVEELVMEGNPFLRADFDHDAARNSFRPFSDTRPLPPVVLETPPWVALDFALPPTVPGPAPGSRQVLRGTLPKLAAGDGSAIAEIPDAVFSDYQRKPEDVYDWVIGPDGRPYYVYILAIGDAAGMHREGTPKYDELKWVLKDQTEGFDDLRVNYAMVGPEGTASKYLEDLQILDRKLKGRTDKLAREESERGWHLRRSVANLYSEALKRQGYRPTAEVEAVRPINPEKLRRAAKEMAEVGATGKEARGGWRRAIHLLEVALEEVRANRGDEERAEVLLEVLDAQRALRDEQAVLRTLSEYMRTAPRSAQARTWLGQLHLQGMNLPTEALHYFDAAIDRDARYGPALVGKGDALTFMGDHREALKSYSRGSDDEARLRTAHAQLRLGKLSEARGNAESILTRDPTNMGATHLRACVLYTTGDLETARAAFEQVAVSPDAHELRAQACYNLGLTCIRLGQQDAALAAFDACAKALQQGSTTGPTPDETVSPSFGRALVAFAGGDEANLREQLDRGRREAPGAAYIELFAGMLASLERNDASAIRALDGALRRAPGYAELDGWLGKTYLRLGELEAETAASPEETAETFERAVAFANRAADRESSADRRAYAARLREVLVRIGAQHLPKKQRYGRALTAVNKILDNSLLREQPAALTLAGYCYFQLEDYEECIRKLQQVLDVVPDEDENEWKLWRDYAEQALTSVKHWRSLEEKLVSFKGAKLGREWETDQSHAVRVVVEEGDLLFKGESNHDGRRDNPTVLVSTGSLFARETFESVTLTLKIPRSVRGRATNNITFGIEVIAASRSGSKKKRPGLGIFYDKNKVAVRVQGGQEKKWKEGNVTRLDPEQAWPEGEEVVVRFVREDAQRGTMAVYLNDNLVLRDNVSTFKLTRGKAALWIGGYSTDTEPFDVIVSDIRVVRRKAR
ncbi:MAG: tetratricopeptide repeat protein [Planctomycetota bacterium]|nr:tetratricopeptide repeat protein [Planctomycetota bacterium]